MDVGGFKTVSSIETSYQKTQRCQTSSPVRRMILKESRSILRPVSIILPWSSYVLLSIVLKGAVRRRDWAKDVSE